MNKRILGLDTGTNSLGWAVVDWDEHTQVTGLLNMVMLSFKKV